MGRLTEFINQTEGDTSITFLTNEPSLSVKILRKSFYLFCQLLFRSYCPLTVKGREMLPTSPFIICSNHCSHMDSIVLMLSSGLPYSCFGMLAAKDYFFDQSKHKIFNNILNLIPIKRKCTRRSLASNLAICKTFIGKGNRNLIIFPEGTRSQTGKMMGFKRGTAMIAIELGIPIIPAYIDGTYRAMPKGYFFPRPARISVVFGKPIDALRYTESVKQDRNNFFTYSLLMDELEKNILALKEEHSES